MTKQKKHTHFTNLVLLKMNTCGKTYKIAKLVQNTRKKKLKHLNQWTDDWMRKSRLLSLLLLLYFELTHENTIIIARGQIETAMTTYLKHIHMYNIMTVFAFSCINSIVWKPTKNDHVWGKKNQSEFLIYLSVSE